MAQASVSEIISWKKCVETLLSAGMTAEEPGVKLYLEKIAKNTDASERAWIASIEAVAAFLNNKIRLVRSKEANYDASKLRSEIQSQIDELIKALGTASEHGIA